MSVRVTPWRALLVMLGASAGTLCSPQARAQVAASLTFASDDRFRGHSITNGDPALTLDVTYDDASGLYLGASATGAVAEGSPRPVNFSENVGFARRLKPGLSLDLGIVRSDYTEYYSGGRKAHFTEVYAGIAARHVRAYLRYSPDYLWPGLQTLYGEVEVGAEPAPNWRVSAHAGVLLRVAGPGPPSGHRASYDWKLGLARQAGSFELGLNLSGGGPDDGYYEGKRHSRTALAATLRWNL